MRLLNVRWIFSFDAISAGTMILLIFLSRWYCDISTVCDSLVIFWVEVVTTIRMIFYFAINARVCTLARCKEREYFGSDSRRLFEVRFDGVVRSPSRFVR